MSHQDPFAANLAEQGAALREQMAHRTALPEDAPSEHPSEHLSESDAADRKAAILQMQEMSLKMRELKARFNVQGDELELAEAASSALPPGFGEPSQAAPAPAPAPAPVPTEPLLTEPVSRAAGPCQAPSDNVWQQSPLETPAVASAAAETPAPPAPGAGPESAIIRDLKSEIAEVMNLVRMQAAQMQIQTAQLQALSSAQASKPAGQGVPAPIDKKVIDRPGKYSGDVRHYIEWSEKFVKFLTRQDPRWKVLLKAAED